MKHIIRTFIFFTILSFANINISLSQVLSADEFEKKYSEKPNAQLLDVRTSGEYGGGHLPKATNIDYRSPEFIQKISTLDKTKPTFVYCLAGGRSKAAVEVLKQNGFTEVYDLQGGYLKWSAGKKPVEGSKENNEAKGYSKSEIDALLNTKGLVILDFFASWCGPCLKMMPTVDKLSQELTGSVKFIKVDADASKAVVEEYKVDEIPTFIIFKDGKQVKRSTGYLEEKALRKMIDNQL
ncbi:thioredoxin domain-containing protein [Arcicella rigui]|uniref:Thioredoxin domain-containing protein n=1 Tax=Arcicella rigui TaxID=797020 RepID=A0ABU5Q7T7_9BACT|nr:thioredoxin domain-containing protein [Arcicella rigui]MEA5138903.1 thioredoxin domain-containing protein [Arcicella rigui]